MKDLFEKINDFNKPIQNRPLILIMHNYSFIYGVIDEAYIDNNSVKNIKFYKFDNNAINAKLSNDITMIREILPENIDADNIKNVITIDDIKVFIDLMAKANIFPFNDT
ncbi:MAG: hypothetical protein HC906_16295 [Bacteroidales bacterium]|nr:hypothetical protein [Bacteroidales bacterium]